MRVLITVLLLLGSNCFMTWAWYGHLKRTGWVIPVAILVSWLIALPEYILQVPANRIGHTAFGGPFSASQLKVLQEGITITVFLVFAIVVLKERPRVNEYVAFGLIFAGVAVAMMGRTMPHEPAPVADAPPPYALASQNGHALDEPESPGTSRQADPRPGDRPEAR